MAGGTRRSIHPSESLKHERLGQLWARHHLDRQSGCLRPPGRRKEIERVGCPIGRLLLGLASGINQACWAVPYCSNIVSCSDGKIKGSLEEGNRFRRPYLASRRGASSQP